MCGRLCAQAAILSLHLCARVGVHELLCSYPSVHMVVLTSVCRLTHPALSNLMPLRLQVPFCIPNVAFFVYLHDIAVQAGAPCAVQPDGRPPGGRLAAPPASGSLNGRHVAGGGQQRRAGVWAERGAHHTAQEHHWRLPGRWVAWCEGFPACCICLVCVQQQKHALASLAPVLVVELSSC